MPSWPSWATWPPPTGWGSGTGWRSISEVEAAEITRGFDEEPGFPDPEARALAVTLERPADLVAVRAQRPHAGGPSLRIQAGWLAALRVALEAEREAGRRLVVCGDFNVAPNDSDVWDMAAFEGSTHVTEPEREAVKALLDLGLTDLHPRSSRASRSPTGTTARATSTRDSACGST